jgi:2-polyprenyl-6-methoxyphenol hydroxylase-like FAD-dependent oxidoreductase
MKLPSSTEILIVGAGPSGLALASELARRSIRFVLIDRQAAGANTSRACVVHARTLEMLEPLGVVPELRARGVEVPIFRVRDRNKALITVDFRHLPSRYAYTLMLPQCETEAVLLAGLEARGGTVLRPCELAAVRPDSEGATVTLQDTQGEHVLRTRYLIACDGMHSRIREQIGIPFEGASYEEAFVLADVRMDWPLARDEVSLLYSPAGLVVVAPIPHDRFRIVATVQEAPPVPSVADIQAILEARGPTAGAVRVLDIAWSSRFHVHHRIARQFRSGRVLLLGDAAHVHSPAGGQGMNTGIQDAISLGGALAETLGTGSESALDAWAQWRHRVASDVIRLADRLTWTATIENRAGQKMRNALIQIADHVPAVRQSLAMKLSELSNRAA